jgi:hypothetical protein
MYWDAWKNEIFTEMYHVITDKEYLIWYMSITRKIITPDPKHVPLLGYM